MGWGEHSVHSRGWRRTLAWSVCWFYLEEFDLPHLTGSLFTNFTSSQMNNVNQGVTVTVTKIFNDQDPGNWPQWPSSAAANAGLWEQGSVTPWQLAGRQPCPSLCFPGLHKHPTHGLPCPVTRFPKVKKKQTKNRSPDILVHFIICVLWKNKSTFPWIMKKWKHLSPLVKV